MQRSKMRCAQCGKETERVFYNAFARRYLCRDCERNAPRHPDLHGPISGAAMTHIARCPSCAAKVMMRRH